MNSTVVNVLTNTVRLYEEQSVLLMKFWAYAIEGVILMATNFTILTTILKHEILRMRKEYIIVGALACTDGLNGLAALLGGLGRNWLLLRGEGFVQRSRWDCLRAPWNLLWVWVEPLVSVMLLTISIDRLLAVSIPFRYFKFSRKYGFFLVGTAYGWMWVSSAVATVSSYRHQTPEYPAICLTQYGLDPIYYLYYTNVRIVCAFASVLIYIAVAIITMTRQKPKIQVNPDRKNTSSAETAYWRRQVRLTNTLGLSCLFTLFLYVLPICVELYSSTVNTSAEMLAFAIPYLYIVNNLNPMANYFLYTLRHRDIRMGVYCLFSGKPLTAVMLKAGHKSTGGGGAANNDVVVVSEMV